MWHFSHTYRSLTDSPAETRIKQNLAAKQLLFPKMLIFISSKNRGRVSQPRSDLGCYLRKSHLGTQGSFVLQLHWVTSNNMHLRFSIITNPLHSKPVGLECQHHPKLLRQATRVGLKYQKRGWVRGEARSQSLSLQNQGTASTKHKGAWTKPLEPEPAGRERGLALDSSYRGQVAKNRARNIDWCLLSSTRQLPVLTPTDTSAGCSKAPLWVSLPTGIRGASAWASPPPLVNALSIYRWSWQRWHRQSGRADRWLWERLAQHQGTGWTIWRNNL